MTAPNIMILFRQWEAAFTEAANPTVSEAEADQLLDICSDLEKAMLAQPATDARDFAAKVLAYTGYGTFTLDATEDGQRLIEEARALVAVPGLAGNCEPAANLLQAVQAARAKLS